ncbi:hypothetical protein Gotur_011866, partial [Gossypium turneri]
TLFYPHKFSHQKHSNGSHFLLPSTPVFLPFIQCRVGALRWLRTRENQTISQLGKGMSGPLLARRVGER